MSGLTELERAIRAQAAELERLATCDFSLIAARLEQRRRVLLVGTGSSQHVAELGALALAQAGLDARWFGSSEFVHVTPKLNADDAVVLISHSARTSFALAAREAALATGAEVISVTGRGGGWRETIETVVMERSHTYTVSVTAALMVLFRLAHQLGATGLAPSALHAAVERVRTIVEDVEIPPLGPPHRALVIVGSGAGALTLREPARVLAEGYAGEYLLHGHAVPLQRGDALLAVNALADPDGLLAALADAARAEGITVAGIDETSIENLVLAQLPLIVRLQLLALRFARKRSTDPDAAIVGHWADESMWAIGRPADLPPGHSRI